MNVPIRTIPTLPAEIDGEPVEWQPWERAFTPSHVDVGCEVCDHDGAPSTALGRYVNRRGRLFAIRCRRCQVCRVLTWQPYEKIRVHRGTNTPTGWGEYVVVWSAPPQSTGDDL